MKNKTVERPKIIIAVAFSFCAVLLVGFLAFKEALFGTISPLKPYLVGEMAALELVTPAPLGAYSVTTKEAGAFDLGSVRGRVLLVNLWASWCAPCRAEMEELAHLQKTLGDERFEVIAVNVDRGGPLMAEEVLAEWGIEGLNVYADASMKIAFGLGKGALPTTIIVNPEGQMIARYLGPLGWDKPESIALFNALKEGKI